MRGKEKTRIKQRSFVFLWSFCSVLYEATMMPYQYGRVKKRPGREYVPTYIFLISSSCHNSRNSCSEKQVSRRPLNGKLLLL
jgi:hypothetical protein